LIARCGYTFCTSFKLYSRDADSTLKSLWNRCVMNLKMLFGMTISRVVLQMTHSFALAGIAGYAGGHVKGTHTIAELVTALVSSLIAMIGTIILDYLADTMEDTIAPNPEYSRQADIVDALGAPTMSADMMLKKEMMGGTRGFIGVFGLLLGLSWEEVFMNGNQTLTEWIDKQVVEHTSWQSSHPVMYQIVLTSIVLSVMIPSWAKYVIPRSKMTYKEHEEAIKAEDAEEHASKTTMIQSAQLEQLRARFFCCCRPEHPDADEESARE